MWLQHSSPIPPERSLKNESETLLSYLNPETASSLLPIFVLIQYDPLVFFLSLSNMPNSTQAQRLAQKVLPQASLWGFLGDTFGHLAEIALPQLTLVTSV